MEVLHGTILLVVGTLTVAGSNHFRSDYRYHAAAEGWFKLHREPANWEDARLRCSLEGAILASPINDDVSDVMQSIVNRAAHIPSSGVYTGVHNTISPAEFASLEGVPLPEMPVGKGEIFSETYSLASSCLRMMPQDRLFAGSCTDYLPYICYKKRHMNLQITECGTVDTEYRLDNRTGHCYKFHRYALTWPLAYLTCASEGGYLAIINSPDEGALVRDIFNQHPTDTILGSKRGGMYLGYYDWNEHNVWRTIHGQTLEEAGFAQWSATQPDNAQSNGIGQHCGAMFRTGLLDDVWCIYNYAFICEKEPTLLPVHQCPL